MDLEVIDFLQGWQLRVSRGFTGMGSGVCGLEDLQGVEFRHVGFRV